MKALKFFHFVGGRAGKEEDMAKKALLVGINRYKIAGADLQGCINDVTNIRDLLLKFFGFTFREIRALVDERATKKISLLA